MKYKKLDDVIVIDLPSEVNVEETKEFSGIFEFLFSEGFSKFIVNFAQTKFISSSFLSTAVYCKKKLFSSKGNFVLVNVSPKIYKLLEITDLVSFFDILSSVDEGLKYFEEKF